MTVFSLGYSPLAVSVFGMGLPELAVIGAIAVVVFGPKKLPELGSSIGKALKGFRQEMNDPGSSEQETEVKAEQPKATETAQLSEAAQEDKAA